MVLMGEDHERVPVRREKPKRNFFQRLLRYERHQTKSWQNQTSVESFTKAITEESCREALDEIPADATSFCGVFFEKYSCQRGHSLEIAAV